MNRSVMLVEMRLVFVAEVQGVLVKFRVLRNEFGVEKKRMMGQPLCLSGFPLGM